MPETPDEDLVARVVASEDAAAYRRLVERHQARIRRWLHQLTGNRADADDLAQETFISAWLHIASFSGKGRFGAWLMKIAYNAYLQSYRRRGRERRLASAFAPLDGEPAVADTPGEVSVDLPKLLGALTEDERATVILNYAHGFSHAEVAELTGLPVGTIKSHIRRGKAKIESVFGLSAHSKRPMEA